MIPSRSYIVTWVSFLAGFISVQRFYLAELYHYVPLIFVLLAVVSLRTKNKLFFSIFSLISLLTCVDNGGGIYNETPTFIRYSSYILCFLAFFYNKRTLSRKALVIYVGWLSLVLIITLLNYENLVLNALVHNIIILCFVLFVFVFKSKGDKVLFCLHIVLFPLAIGMVVGELINIIIHFDIRQGYLNYNSIKSLIIYPGLYVLCKRKFLLAILLIPLTLFILVFYVTRMIIISFLMVILVVVAAYLLKNFLKSLVAICSLLIILMSTSNYINFEEDDLSSYKVTSMINVLTSDSEGDLSNILRKLDPVRFGELSVLIDAPIFNMIFGNGLGASYFDNNNTFDFVGKHDFAFSEEELESRRFYNFHDIWSDVGFRIGLAPLALLFIWLIRKYWKLSSRDDESFIPLFCIVLLFCAFFSTAGIIFIFIILNNIYEKINYK